MTMNTNRITSDIDPYTKYGEKIILAFADFLFIGCVVGTYVGLSIGLQLGSYEGLFDGLFDGLWLGL